MIHYGELIIGVDSFEISGVPSISLMAKNGKFNGVNHSSSNQESKKQLETFITILTDIKDNWEILEKYYADIAKVR